MGINREYLGSFQNKLVSSSFKWMPKYILFLAKLKGEGKLFGMEKHKLSLWTYILYGGNVNYYKNVHHPILTRKNREHPVSKLISKLCFQLSFQVYSLLGQTLGEREAFFDGCKKRSHIVRLPRRALGCHKRWKSISFLWNLK